MLAVFLCKGCAVCCDHMDVKEQRCKGCAVCCDHMAVSSHLVNRSVEWLIAMSEYGSTALVAI
jgi:hypothetical protein